MEKVSVDFPRASALYDLRPLEPRHKRLFTVLTQAPLGTVVPYRAFFDEGVPLADIRIGITTLRRALRPHGIGIKNHRSRGYSLYRIN
jgi:hypothetical protein